MAACTRRSSAERLPLADQLADAVVSTWTLCTIPDPRAGLAEMKRVLKPEGHFVFIEHGRGPNMLASLYKGIAQHAG